MDIQTAKRAVLMVGLSGGSVSIVSADGEVIATEGLTPGRHKCDLWVPFMSSEGDKLTFEGDVSPMVPSGNRVRRMAYGAGSHDSGANPDFTVTSADRMARELDLKVRSMNNTADKIERRLAQINELAKRTNTDVQVAKGEETDVVDNDDVGDIHSDSGSGDDPRPEFSADNVAPE